MDDALALPRSDYLVDRDLELIFTAFYVSCA